MIEIKEGLIEKNASMLDEIESKTETKKMIDRGERSKTLSEVKLVENISKNPQSFLQISIAQKKIFL